MVVVFSVQQQILMYEKNNILQSTTCLLHLNALYYSTPDTTKRAGSAVQLRSQFQQFTISNKCYNMGGHLQVPRSEAPSSFRRWTRFQQSFQQNEHLTVYERYNKPPLSPWQPCPNGWFAQAGVRQQPALNIAIQAQIIYYASDFLLRQAIYFNSPV